MKSLTNQAAILTALAHTPGLTDRELANRLGLPHPSVRRTRLHLVIAGRLVKAANGGWLVKPGWALPDRYTGIQKL